MLPLLISQRAFFFILKEVCKPEGKIYAVFVGCILRLTMKSEVSFQHILNHAQVKEN